MAFSSPRTRTLPGGAATAPPVVFISYSHEESALALAFAEALRASGLAVRIDVEHLRPGEDITEFARESVRQADATVCIVSPVSLKSAWVMFEAMITLQKESADPTTRLIACATSASVLSPDFGLEVTHAIDQRLVELNGLISEYLVKQLDLNDVSIERSRWMRMRAGFGDVLDRVRNHLTLIVGTDNLADSATRIADHIRERHGLAALRYDPRDIRERADELRRHLFEGRTDDALDRLLDFVREFSDLSAHVRSATLISNSLRRIEQGMKERQVSFNQAEKLRQPQIRELLALIDDIEVQPNLPVAS